MNCCRLGFRYTVVGSWDFVNFVSGPSDRPSSLSLDCHTYHILKYDFIGWNPLGVFFFFFFPKGLHRSCWLKALKTENLRHRGQCLSPFFIFSVASDLWNFWSGTLLVVQWWRPSALAARLRLDPWSGVAKSQKLLSWVLYRSHQVHLVQRRKQDRIVTFSRHSVSLCGLAKWMEKVWTFVWIIELLISDYEAQVNRGDYLSLILILCSWKGRDKRERIPNWQLVD